MFNLRNRLVTRYHRSSEFPISNLVVSLFAPWRTMVGRPLENPILNSRFWLAEQAFSEASQCYKRQYIGEK